jgi:hypothetical protein
LESHEDLLRASVNEGTFQILASPLLFIRDVPYHCYGRTGPEKCAGIVANGEKIQTGKLLLNGTDGDQIPYLQLHSI